MTAVHFSQQDVRRWADFSGDHNPIHFDTKTAHQLIGEKGPFVHGMLAMLPLKQAFSDSLAQTENGGTWRWHAQLRRPIPISGRYRVASGTLANGSHNYQLQSVIGDERFITAIATPQADISKREGHGKFLLDTQDITDINSFCATTSATYPNWIGLDALLFGHYVKANLPELLRDLGLDTTGKKTSGSERTELLMQISHTIIAERWALDCRDIRPCAPFSYDITPVSTALAGETRYATLQLSLFGNNRLFLIQELSLMLALPAPRLTSEFGVCHDHIPHP